VAVLVLSDDSIARNFFNPFVFGEGQV